MAIFVRFVDMESKAFREELLAILPLKMEDSRKRARSKKVFGVLSNRKQYASCGFPEKHSETF